LGGNTAYKQMLTMVNLTSGAFQREVLRKKGLTDDVLMPKWYGVVMMGMVAATIHLTLPKWEDKVYRGRYMGSSLQMVAMLVLTYHLVYALVADVIMRGSPVIKGVFDNPTGFALHTCVLVGVIEANRPSSRPPSMGEAFIEITGRRTIRQVSIILVWILTLLSAVMVFLSGCRTGMVCMAVIILLMFYREMRQRIKPGVMRLWGTVISSGVLLAVVLYVFSVKQESTGGRQFILERTWELIEERPLIGYGWHGFEREYMVQQADYFRQHPNSPAAWYADEISHPLNEFLYLWVDFGITAPILLLLLFAIPYYTYHRKKDMLLGQMTLPLTVVLVFSMTSYPFLYPLPWVVVALTYIVMMRKPISRLKQRYRKTVTVTSIGICIAGLTLTIWEMTREHEWAKLNRGVERHYTAAVIDRYDRLSGHYSCNPRFLYSYMVAQYKVSRLDEATNTYHQLRQYADTYDMELLAGDTYRHKQLYAKALQHYETAMWMCPVRFAPLEGMMQTYRDSGDLLRADSIAQIILAKPVKVLSPQVEEIKRKAREGMSSKMTM
ncbi:MAG: O-antigen ligase family protein, partial [Prevotella sp.]|nr:O-antigen ligase family protein [Prevotella sp.]